ncbi:DUF6090 family protein [Aestuariibaculum sediminum]|uniref:Uncharacterized protein n=1 Tax=Aestuariibaculum sediminum TaxID=2770637 RepID=A0A8J6QAY6_9FLAO|nr:DUF6090 family protein [Aestuariibaculum sediminum]MBD0832416.1 hypothetical protein [Aestuariibaculum sediminum]
MIKFFKNFRKTLINEGKTTKYFKYAIGEIVLVVIGILIALQINNWNENRLTKIVKSNYLKQIKAELILDVTNFKKDIRSIKTYTEYLNKVSEGNYNNIDLSLLLNYLCRNLEPGNCGISFNKMLESNTFEEIDGETIKEKLQTYYLTNCAEYNNLTAFHSKFISENIEGPLLLILNHKKGFLVDPKEVIEQLEVGKLKSMINWQISYLNYYIPSINKNISLAEELIQLINHD